MYNTKAFNFKIAPPPKKKKKKKTLDACSGNVYFAVEGMFYLAVKRRL